MKNASIGINQFLAKAFFVGHFSILLELNHGGLSNNHQTVTESIKRVNLPQIQIEEKETFLTSILTVKLVM